MRKLVRWTAGAVLVIGGAVGYSSVTSAQNAGDVITFLVPSAGTQPDIVSDPKDKLIITGGSITSTSITGCGTGSRPVQNSVLVDPGSKRSGRLSGVIIVSQTTAVNPGTKLKDISLESTCEITETPGTPGTQYSKYNGVVE